MGDSIAHLRLFSANLTCNGHGKTPKLQKHPAQSTPVAQSTAPARDKTLNIPATQSDARGVSSSLHPR
jgi:hypothetical protein